MCQEDKVKICDDIKYGLIFVDYSLNIDYQADRPYKLSSGMYSNFRVFR